MKAKIEYLLEKYNTQLNNLQWHLDKNGQYTDMHEMKVIKQQIADFEFFIEDLTLLNNSIR